MQRFSLKPRFSAACGLAFHGFTQPASSLLRAAWFRSDEMCVNCSWQLAGLDTTAWRSWDSADCAAWFVQLRIMDSLFVATCCMILLVSSSPDPHSFTQPGSCSTGVEICGPLQLAAWHITASRTSGAPLLRAAWFVQVCSVSSWFIAACFMQFRSLDPLFSAACGPVYCSL